MNFYKNFSQKINQAISIRFLQLSLLIASSLSSLTAWADLNDPSLGGSDAGELAQKLNGELTSMKSVLWTAAQVVGICMALGGILLWRSVAAGKSQLTYGKAILLIILGAVAFFLPYVMGTAASSLLSG